MILVVLAIARWLVAFFSQSTSPVSAEITIASGAEISLADEVALAATNVVDSTMPGSDTTSRTNRTASLHDKCFATPTFNFMTISPYVSFRSKSVCGYAGAGDRI